MCETGSRLRPRKAKYADVLAKYPVEVWSVTQPGSMSDSDPVWARTRETCGRFWQSMVPYLRGYEPQREFGEQGTLRGCCPTHDAVVGRGLRWWISHRCRATLCR